MTSEAVERLVRVSIDLTKLGTRNERGDRITAEWGEPDESGIYTPVFTAQTDPQLAAALDLGLAWQEAEAALPEGWQFIRMRWRRIGHWTAFALKTEGMQKHVLSPARTGIGPTPAAALRNLTARLREVTA